MVGTKNLVIVNDYNPCQRLMLDKLKDLERLDKTKIVWCGNFNANNSLLGIEKIDGNGQVIEDLLDENNLVCLNDGSKTKNKYRFREGIST